MVSPSPPNTPKPRPTDTDHDHDDDTKSDNASSSLTPAPAPTSPATASATGRERAVTASPIGDAHQALTSQTLNADGTPKRPMNAFMIFARRRRPQVSAANQMMRTGEISKILSKEWNGMTIVSVGSSTFFFSSRACVVALVFRFLDLPCIPIFTASRMKLPLFFNSSHSTLPPVHECVQCNRDDLPSTARHLLYFTKIIQPKPLLNSIRSIKMFIDFESSSHRRSRSTSTYIYFLSFRATNNFTWIRPRS
jgi:hypothetical protein